MLLLQCRDCSIASVLYINRAKEAAKKIYWLFLFFALGALEAKPNKMKAPLLLVAKQGLDEYLG